MSTRPLTSGIDSPGGRDWSKATRSLQPGHPRHRLIGDDQIDTALRLDQVGRRGDRVRAVDVVAHILEHRRGVLQHQRIVIDREVLPFRDLATGPDPCRATTGMLIFW